MLRLAEVRQVGVVLGVVVLQVVGEEGPEHPLTDAALQLVGGHAPVQRVGGDELDVVDALRGSVRQHRLQHALTDVGGDHLRQWDRDVVEDDGQPHAGEQQLRERLHVERVQQRLLDGGGHVGQTRQRVRRVDDPGAERELLQVEALAGVDEQRRRALVHLQHEAGAGAARFGHAVCSSQACGSKAILRVPRRPAAKAWSSASRHWLSA